MKETKRQKNTLISCYDASFRFLLVSMFYEEAMFFVSCSFPVLFPFVSRFLSIGGNEETKPVSRIFPTWKSSGNIERPEQSKT
jgi:hypothetical protein